MEDRGTVLSIKFSLDHKILAVQRTNTSIEFMNFNKETLDSEYSISCKKNSNVLGFVWSNINELGNLEFHSFQHFTLSLFKLEMLNSRNVYFSYCD